MRTARTKAGLLKRLELLECRVELEQRRIVLRFGHLKQLPRDYEGERHVVITKHLPPQGDREWVEFEERPGPGPNPTETPNRNGTRYMDIRLVGGLRAGGTGTPTPRMESENAQ